MPYNAGDAYLQIVPVFRGMVEKITAEARSWGRPAGEAFSQSFNDEVRSRTGRVPLGPSRSDSARAGEASAGAFADGFRAKVTAALRNLPKPRVGVDATEADAELADIRARLSALGDVRVGVDLSDTEALAELDRLKARLDELGARSPDIRVRVDTARASAELAAFRAEVDAVGAASAASASGSGGLFSGLISGASQSEATVSGLTLAIAGLGPALIPVGAAAIGAFAGIATAALAAVSGIGVLALALGGVAGAVKLLNQREQAQQVSAEQTAQKSAASALAQQAAAQGVQSAEASLANTRAQAADAQVSAAERVQTAEQSLTAANQQAADAQKALNDAREQAVRDLEDAANRQADAGLAARQAALDLAQAQQNLANLGAGGQPVTELQRQQAILGVLEARQRLTEAEQEAGRAAADNRQAQQQGVAGDRNVVSAQQQVTAAVQAQAQARQGLADAQRAQVAQARQSAFAVSQAEAQLANAMRAVQAAARAASGTSLTALDRINEKLAEVPKGVLGLAVLFQSTVEPIFKRLQDAAASALAPGIAAGIRLLTPLVGPLTTFVSGLARTMGGLFESASRALASPFWRQFFDYVSRTAGPTLVIMARTLGAVGRGFAGLLQAFAPVALQMGRGLQHLAERFADWATHLASNRSFQSFLAYIQRNGPQIARTVGDLAVLFGNIVVALAPLGEVLVPAIGALARFLSALSPNELLAITAVVGGLVFVLTGGALAGVAFAAGIVAVMALLARNIPAISRFFSGMFHGIETGVSDVIHAFAWFFDLPVRLGKALDGFLAGLGLTVGRLLTGLAGDVGATLSSVAGDVGSALSGFAEAVGRFFASLPGAILNAVESFGTLLYNAGRNLITGLLNGIVDSVGGLLDKVGSIGGDILSTLGSAIGLGSPSRITRQYGQWVVEGLAIGIAADQPAVAAARRTSARVMDAFDLAGMRLGGDYVHRRLGIAASAGVTAPTLTRQVLSSVTTNHGGMHLHGDWHVAAAPGEMAAVSIPRALRNKTFELGV